VAVSRIVAATLILALMMVNYRGIRLGAGVQNTFTALKVLGLVLLICSMFISTGKGAPQEPGPVLQISAAQLGAAIIAAIWAYNGWFAVSLVAGEIKDPQRNLPRALIAGMIIVTAIYLLANIGYVRTLTISEIAASERVAANAAGRTMGSIGASFVALTILVSTLGTTNGNLMTAPRLYFAQARDGLFFQSFGNIHPVFKTPYIAILGQGIWASVLVLSGSYSQLVSFATFTFWIFYGMTVAGLMVLRRRRPDAPRPYRMSGYPATAVIFVAVAVWVAVAGIVSAPATSAIGVLILASGVPAYYFWRKR